MLTNPKYVERIKNMFANTQFDFRMWFVNSPEAGKQAPLQGVGRVSVEWLEDNMPDTLYQIDNAETLNTDRSFGRQAINVIFTSNYPYSKAGGYRPMTGWIIAHRMAHVILNPDRFNWESLMSASRSSTLDVITRDVLDKFQYIFDMYGMRPPLSRNPSFKQTRDPMFLRFLSQIGTMRSARETKVLSWYEFIYECFAQYLLKGAVTFNPPPLQVTQGYAYGRARMSNRLGGPEQSEANYALEYVASVMEQEFDRALNGAMGKIYVM